MDINEDDLFAIGFVLSSEDIPTIQAFLNADRDISIHKFEDIQPIELYENWPTRDLQTEIKIFVSTFRDIRLKAIDEVINQLYGPFKTEAP